MRISELERVTGVPVASIKYYLREGLLPPGATTAPNQADYGDVHVHRMRLIRALREVGGLGIAQVRGILAAIDDPDLPLHHLLGVAHRALGPAIDTGLPADDELEARADVDLFLNGLGWKVGADAPARRTLGDALAALRRLGRAGGAEVFLPYAEAADGIARRELSRVRINAPRSEMVEGVVVGTVVFETALAALRRLAHEHYSALRFEGQPE